LGKIFDRSELKEAVRKWRSAGKTIVFTNGCFDILHRGHVEYLNLSKELGDILVLGLNSDKSVRILKGEGRPLVPEEDRAFILSQLISVDAVSIFEEETPHNLLRVVSPDILVKGGDYTLEEVVGREIVEEYNGKIVTVPVITGTSTTNVIEKIKSTNRGS
jgi:D-beta-D-heptose 7-phosphate kinase/D-beta-D-heptose 1-phosphate adenosyltransferase